MFKSKRSSLNSVNGVYDGGAITSEGSFHSILRNGKGKKKKKKKKNVDRSVKWSNEFQTYEERNPQSFDDYEDDDYSYNRDTFDDEDDDDYTLEHAEQKPSGLSSIFAPIALPANFKTPGSLPEDDASLIETMDNYYDGGDSKAESDDDSMVSYERIHDFQHEIDGDNGHLGLVMPSLGGFFSVLGVNHARDDVTDVTSISASSSSCSASTYRSEVSEVVEEAKVKSSRRTNSAAASTKSKEKVEKSTNARSVPQEKKIECNPKETKVKKKKAKSTVELNIAIQEILGTKSSESSNSSVEVISTLGVSVKPSCSDDLIEPLEASKSVAIKPDVESSRKKKKRSSMFGIKNKRKSSEKVEVDKHKSLVDSTKTILAPKASSTPAVPQKKVESLVENAMNKPQIKSQRIPNPVAPNPVVQSPVVKSVAVAATEIKNSFSGSTDESSLSLGKKDKEKNKMKMTLMNKLSFRRKKSTNFSGRELAFAYAQQQQLAPLEDMSEFRRESSDEVDDVVEEEQRGLSTKRAESIMQEPAHNTTSDNVKMQDERKNTSTISRKKVDAPVMEKKKPEPLKLVQDPNANRVIKEVNNHREVKNTEGQVTAHQPTITKKEKEMAPLKEKEQPKSPKVMPRSPEVTADVKKPQQKDIVDPLEITTKESASAKKQENSPKRVKEPEQAYSQDPPKENMRGQLYDMILNADSFDSVSTTEDILDELQQIEDAAQQMYESMVMERGVPAP